MRSMPDGAYHLIGSSRFQSARCERIVLSPVCKSSFVTAPLVGVSATVNRNRPSGENAIMSLSPGTVVCDAKAFLVGAAASPFFITVVASVTLDDHLIDVAEQVCGASVIGTKPSRFATPLSLTAVARPASVSASNAPRTGSAKSRSLCFIAYLRLLGGRVARRLRKGSELVATAR